jgi:UPF0755 protein
VQQIFADNTKFTESQVYVYVPTDANWSQEITSPYIDQSGAFRHGCK